MASPYGSHFDGTQWPWRLDGEPDWYVLRDATGRYVSDACVEGTADEWREVAASLRVGDSSERNKRLCARRCGDHYEFCSPRNTLGGHAVMPADRAAELADIINAALACHEHDEEQA